MTHQTAPAAPGATILPLPRWRITTRSGWALYLGISRPTLYKAIREHRFLIRRDDVVYVPAPLGKPRGRRG